MRSEHPHNGITRKQRLQAWIIMSVYIPMVLLASLHVHSPNDFSRAIDCDQCHTAVHHSGHISTSHLHLDECLSCRFLSTQMDVPRTVTCFVIKQVIVHLESYFTGEAAMRFVVRPSLRAPPFVL